MVISVGQNVVAVSWQGPMKPHPTSLQCDNKLNDAFSLLTDWCRSCIHPGT